ncbi:unnamed protein product, partial [Closterium sp. NIES-53]
TEPRRPVEPRRTTEPRRPAEPRCPSACTASAATAATAATATTAATSTMASPTVLTFDAEGRAVDFDVWIDDLQLFLQCDSRDGVSLFDHTSGVSAAPAATADSTVRSKWTTHDAVARLAVRSHLPSAERVHFGQYKTAQSLYDAVVARYSSPATAALSRLMLPYLFPGLAAFATVADLITHLRTSHTRYCATLPTEGVPLSPFSPLLLLLLLTTSLALRRSGLRLLLVGGAAPAGARGARVVEGTVGEAVEEVERAEGVALEVGVVAEVEALVAAVGVVEAAAAAVEAAAMVVEVAAAVVLAEVQPRSVEALVVASASSSRIPVRPRRPSSFMSGMLGVGGLGVQNVAIFDLDFDAILAAMYAVTDSAEGDSYLSVPPDAGIEAAALGASASAAPGTSASAAPGGGESALSGTAPTEALHTFTLDSSALRSFFRDSTTLTPLSRPVAVSLADPSRGPDLAHSSTVQPCPAAPSGLLSGLQLPSFSTNSMSGADLQDAWVDHFTPGGQRVTHCTCSRTGRLLATFTRRPGSSLYTLTTASPPVTVSGQVAASGQGHERYFLLVIDDYSRYTTVFPLRSKDRSGEFSSDLLRAFCRAEGIRQTFTLPASPQQNGIAERRIGMYAAHQINLQPRVSLPETTPTLRWTGKLGDASVFRVWGSRAFVRDTTADKLSSRAVPCVFLGFPPDAPGWQLFHPTARRVLSSQDVTFDESVDPAEPVKVAVDSGAAGSVEPAGAETGGAEPGVAVSERAEPGGAEPERVEPGGAEPGGTASGGAESERAESGGPPGVPSRREPLSPQQLREGYARRCRGAAGAACAGAAGGAAGGPRGARTGDTRAAEAGGAARVGAAVAGAVATGGASGAGASRGTGAGGATGQLQPASPLPGPSPYSGPTRGLTERREPESHPVSPKSRPASPESRSASPVHTFCAGRRVSRPRPPPVPGTHSMTLRPSTAPQRVPLPSPPASSLPDDPDAESDSLRVASPAVTHFLATAFIDPLFESTAA